MLFHTKTLNYEFSNYLNRYLTGIIKLREKIKKIKIGYELADAFSNHSCRFIIDVIFFDFEALTQKEIQTTNTYFYNSNNRTGVKYVSFIYQHQKSNEVDFFEINSFINHYEFSRSLFEGFILKILPQQDILEIENLEEEPLFNYTKKILAELSYEYDDIKNPYRKKTGRRFNFDVSFHKVLKEASEHFSEIIKEKRISDKEIYENSDTSTEALRRYILNHKIPFNINQWSKTIDEINIDIISLKEKILTSPPTNFYLKFDGQKILGLINEKEKDLNRKKLILKKLKIDHKINISDYLIIEKDYWGDSTKPKVGIIKEISLGYRDELVIKYNILKNDLTESKLPVKEIDINKIDYIINQNVFAKIKHQVRNKTAFIRIVKNKKLE